MTSLGWLEPGIGAPTPIKYRIVVLRKTLAAALAVEGSKTGVSVR